MGALLNRRRVMGGGDNIPLPSGYKRVKYLQSDQGQYIDTGIVLALPFHAKITGCWTRFYGSGQTVLGMNYQGTYFSDVLVSSSRNTFCRIGGSSDSQTLSATSFGTVLTYDIVGDINGNITISDSEGNTTQHTSSRALYTSQRLFLFCTNSNTKPGSYSFFNMYGASLSIADEMKFDYIPVQKDGIGAMYDLVTEQIFENKGTRDFILP